MRKEKIEKLKPILGKRSHEETEEVVFIRATPSRPTKHCRQYIVQPSDTGKFIHQPVTIENISNVIKKVDALAINSLDMFQCENIEYSGEWLLLLSMPVWEIEELDSRLDNNVSWTA